MKLILLYSVSMMAKKVLADCGTSSGAFSWQVRPAIPRWYLSYISLQLGISSGVYTAAPSQAIYDSGGKIWCGSGSGKCYKLISTGKAPCNGCGSGGAAGQSIVVMATNLCPHNGNEQWCPAVGGTNNCGYSYHFDIMAKSLVFGDNPVVDFEQVSCPGAAS
jgi:endoglucanase